jgi:hypothetical protein
MMEVKWGKELGLELEWSFGGNTVKMEDLPPLIIVRLVAQDDALKKEAIRHIGEKRKKRNGPKGGEEEIISTNETKGGKFLGTSNVYR